MRVHVTSSGHPVDAQIRTYAEYRIFSTLAVHDHVLGARVTLRADDEDVHCHVHVSLRPYGSVHTSTHAPHATAAIDRAADRIAALVGDERSRFRLEIPGITG